MTRLYQQLLIRLIPDEMLEAIDVLYKEQVRRLQSEPRLIAGTDLLTPQAYAVEVVGSLLDTARNAGWRPLAEDLAECVGFRTEYDQ